MAAAFIANLIRYKQEGYRPDRDIIVALETDEEILDRDAMGIQWLLKNHRDLIDAEFALNEGGGVGLKNGKPMRNSVQTSRKGLGELTGSRSRTGAVTARCRRKDNAIYHLAEGLARLSKFSFPVQVQRDDARLFRTHRRKSKPSRPPPTCDRSYREPRSGRAVADAALRQSRLQRATAHDLRRDNAGGRPRDQRAAAAGARHGQLPHHAGRAGR